MFLVFCLLFIVGPIAELYVIIQVAHVIGVLETLALLIAESMFGLWLMKRHGIGVLNRVGQALEERTIPGRELADSFLILLAGALLFVPGFITGAIGLLLLLPPTRALARWLLGAWFKRGRYGRVFTVVSAPGRVRTTRFVGTFRAGDVQDVEGHDVQGHVVQGHVVQDVEGHDVQDRPDRPELRS